MELGPLLAALRTARPNGAAVHEWAVYTRESRTLSLGVKDRQVGSPHVPLDLGESGSARYLMIWDDGRVSRGILERRLVEHDLAQALEHARAAAYDDPAAAWVLDPAPYPDVEMYDPRADALAGGDTALLAPRLAAIRRRVDEGGFRTWSGSFSARSTRARMRTSSGIDVATTGTTFGWHVTLDGVLGDGFGARAPEDDVRFQSRLDRLVELARQLKAPATAREGGLRPVILHPNVVEAYVLNTLLDNLSGATVDHGEGHFRREQFGSRDPVLREDLTLRLDPLEPLKCGSYRFTAEGLPAARCTYIERGRLVNPLVDCKYSRRLKMAPTPLPLSIDTLHFDGPTPLSPQAALERADGGGLVLSVLGTHTQDSASGDFSLSAPQTLAIESGGFAGRLRATISGNLFELLSDDELRFVRFEGEHTPGLLLRCRLDPQ